MAGKLTEQGRWKIEPLYRSKAVHIAFSNYYFLYILRDTSAISKCCD